jgi:hypothetical protein
MTKTKPVFEAPKSVAVAPPIACIVDGDVGGVGKSLLAIMLATAFSLVEAAMKIFELDEQGKLARFLGPQVESLHAARLDADADGERDLLPVFARFHEALTSMPQTGQSLLLEVGGALTELANTYVAEVDIDEDITALNLIVVVFLVVVATEESVRQVLGQLQTLRRILPSARVVIVRNERDGCPIEASRDMPENLAKGLGKALSIYPSIRMPRLRLKSRRLFEALGEAPVTVISWRAEHFREAMARTKRPLAEAKRLVNDVAAWSGTIHSELTRILPFLGGGNALRPSSLCRSPAMSYSSSPTRNMPPSSGMLHLITKAHGCRRSCVKKADAGCCGSCGAAFRLFCEPALRVSRLDF